MVFQAVNADDIAFRCAYDIENFRVEALNVVNL